MPSLATYQTQLFEYLLGTDGLALEEHVALLGASPTEAQRRLAVYRNNYFHSMSQSLGDSFPVINRLLGDNFFNALAREYIQLTPPQSASLLEYGHSFLAFIEQHPTTQDLPYLSDVGQIEWFYMQCFHGPDAKCLTLYDLLEVDEGLLPEVSFSVQPNLYLLHSEFPALEIWQANLEEDVPSLDLRTLPETFLMLYRDKHDVVPMQLNAIAFRFVSELIKGSTIEQAWQETKALSPDSNDDEVSDLLSFVLQLPVFEELHIND